MKNLGITKLLLLLVMAMVMISCAEKPTDGLAKITGTWDREVDTELVLFKIVDGNIVPLATAAIQDDKRFAFAVPIAEEGFLVLGTKETQRKTSRYTFYFKPGDQLNLLVNDSTYSLLGENTKENIEVEKWHNVIYPLEELFYINKNTKRGSTFKDFFPLAQSISEGLDKQSYKTKNDTFNASFKRFREVDFVYHIITFNMFPRAIHPTNSDYPKVYQDINIDDYVSDASILKHPYGAKLLNSLLYVTYRMAGKPVTPETFLTAFKNDTLIGEEIVMKAANIKSYAVLDSYVEENAKYILTDAQKERVEAIKLKLIDSQKLEGDVAIDFTYPDINGKMVSLSQQKGKVVLIDVWATWCGPCKKEIPYLAKLEEEYHGKDIVFMSVSVDEANKKQDWENFVQQKKLGGLQLFAGGFQSDIAKYYGIKGIPRFILVDKEGKLVSISAPRPSSPELKSLIDKLLK